MKENVYIDVLVPTYRRPELLKRMIHSILNQTYPYFHVYVYDDASNDETGDIVQKIMNQDTRVHYYCHQFNIGFIKNYITAQASVQSPYFTIQSDDDYLHPDFLANAMKEFTEFPDSIFVSLNTTIVNLHGRIIRKNSINKLLGGYYSPPHGLLKILQTGLLNWAGIVFKKEAIDKVGLFSENQRFAIDLEYLVRICAHHPFRISPVPGAFFTEHDANASAICRFDWIWPHYLEIIHLIADDQKLPAVIREKCTALLLNRLKKRLLYAFIASLQHQFRQDSLATIDVISNYFDSKYLARFLMLVMHLYYLHPDKAIKVLNLIVANKPRIVSMMDWVGFVKGAIGDMHLPVRHKQ